MTAVAPVYTANAPTVTFALGIYDLFAYAIPGALQLVFLLYLGQRWQWVNTQALTQVPSGLLLVAMTLVSYLLGHLQYPVGWLFDRVARSRGRLRWETARQGFLSRNPSAEGRHFIDADAHLLLAAVELHAREVAAEITRLRVTGLMLRGCAVPLACGALSAAVELAITPARLTANAVTALLVVATIMAMNCSIRLRGWALAKTFELAFWVPGIDDKVRLTAAPLIAIAPADAPAEEGGLLEQADALEQ